MVRIAAFFIAGILLAIYQPDFIPLTAWQVTLPVTALLFLAFEIFTSGNSFGTIKGALGLGLIFLLGYIHLLLQTDSRSEDHLLNSKEPILYYEAIIKSAPEAKANSWKIELELLSAKTDQWHPVKGKVLAYVSKKSEVLKWRYEDHLLIQGAPSELKPPANPGEFDFKRFLTFKNIYHQHYIPAENIKWIGPADLKSIIYYSHQARAWASDKIDTYIHGNQEQAIAMALILGVTDSIDNEVLNAYAASGAMHVLAVSGMHVGIIYAIVLFVLKPLNRYAWGRWMIAAISLLLLWMFAFVTGLTPSVLRAVTMFSFMVVARPFNRGTNIYNTLAASAFVLLIYNPYLIMSVGFQLSYLAVLGIVYLYKPIYHLWEIKNRIGDWIWQMTCLSLVAQVATFSLGLLYFHQFPVYFLASNLFVIPMSTLVLLLGIVFLSVSFIAPLAQWTGQLTEWSIQLLNWTVFKTEQLPYSRIADIHINTLQCWLLMGLLLSLIFIFQFRSVKWLYTAVGFTVLFTYFQWVHFSESVSTEKWIIYSVNGHRAMEWISHGQSHFYADSMLFNEADRIRFHIQPNRLLTGVERVQSDSIPFQREVKKGISLFYWNDKVIANVHKKEAALPSIASVDYVVVSNNAVASWNELKKVKANQIIFDGSNSKWWMDKMRKQALADSIMIHSVMDDGAFIVTN